MEQIQLPCIYYYQKKAETGKSFHILSHQQFYHVTHRCFESPNSAVFTSFPPNSKRSPLADFYKEIDSLYAQACSFKRKLGKNSLVSPLCGSLKEFSRALDYLNTRDRS